MASSKKGTISLRLEDEEGHLKEEIDLNKEPKLDQADLNREAERDDDATHEEEADEDKIVASESAISEEAETKKKKKMESEYEDVNQEEDDVYLKKRVKAFAVEREGTKKRKTETRDEEVDDDSEQTLRLLSRWETPETPPKNIVPIHLIEQCTRPIRKQLTKSDVEQSKLALPKSQVSKKFLHLLEEPDIPRGKKGIPVYGPNGKVHEMKMWSDEKNPPDLTTGWRKFVGDYELKKCCDFVTIWMFRNRVTRQICLAVDAKRFSFKKQVSKRISKAAFENSD